MGSIGITIPQKRNNTLSPDEVHRPDMDRRTNWAEEDSEAPQYFRNKAGIESDIDDLGDRVTTLNEGLTEARREIRAIEDVTVAELPTTSGAYILIVEEIEGEDPTHYSWYCLSAVQ